MDNPTPEKHKLDDDSLEDFLSSLAETLKIPKDQMTSVIKLFHVGMFYSKKAVLDLSEEDLKELKIPMAITRGLRIKLYSNLYKLYEGIRKIWWLPRK